MNLRLLSRILGWLLLLLAAAMGFCVAFEWLDEMSHPNESHAVGALLMSMAVTGFAGFSLVLAGRGSGMDIMKKEAISIVGLGWILSAVFGALPYMLCKPALGIVPAIFEAMSGFTTTGSSVIPDLTEYSRGIILWRALTQWMGGVGILVLFVAVLSILGVGSKALFRFESSVNVGGGFQSRIREIALSLWKVYSGITAAGILGLRLLGMSWFDAVIHTFAAVSTGGFSNRNESIAFYHSVGIEMWLVVIMVLGGANFILFLWLLRGRWDRWKVEEEARLYLAILGVSTLAIAVQLWSEGVASGISDALRQSVFQVSSIMTTTGFASADFDRWPGFSKALLVLLMFIGGCSGSTGGGLKVSRVLLFFRIIRQELVKAFRPGQVVPLRLNGRIAEEGVRVQTLFILTLGGLSTAAGTLLLLIFDPRLDLESAFTGVVACLFNIGPGLGAVGPTMNFAFLSDPTLAVLTLLMALGRLEFYAILVLFLPLLWRKY